MRGRLGLFTAFMISFSSMAEGEPRHLYLAEDIVENIRNSDNEVGTDPSYLLIPGIDDVERFQSRNLCATFITNLLKKAYGVSDREFRSWSGSTSPYSRDYYELIAAENGFEQLTRIGQLQAGDFIFFAYGPDADVTGHSMVVASPPERLPGHAPSIGEHAQYAIEVIDNGAGHGREDSRFPRLSGVGRGMMRAYVDPDGVVIGFAWSMADYATLYYPPEKEFAMGRLVRFSGE